MLKRSKEDDTFLLLCCWKDDLKLLFSSFDLFFFPAELLKWGEVVIILCNICIVNIAVMFRHFQRRVTEEPLQSKSIATAVDKIFPGERMTEHMYTRFLHPPAFIESYDCKPEGIFGKHFPILIAEEIIRTFSASDIHIIPENRYHLTA